MRRIFYHGTSADNLESILKNGLSCNESKIWNCSGDEVYLWDTEAVGKEWEVDGAQAEDRAFQAAYESAQIACIASKDCRAVVLKIELDDSDIQPDLSCENMEGRGAVCIYRDILPAEILEIKISNDLSLLKGWFIATMLTNEYFGLELNSMEKRIGEALQKAEIYPDDIEYMTEWEIVPLRKKLKRA